MGAIRLNTSAAAVSNFVSSSVTMSWVPERKDSEALSDRGGEQELIRRCIAGEREAQDQLYARYRRQVAANIYRILGDGRELEDLVQEVFLIAFRGLPSFRHEARLSTWLYRIAVNVALGKIRQRRRRPPPIPVAPEMIEGDNSRESPPTPEAELRRKQAAERVYRTLARLSPKKRLVLFLHEIEGRELKEIAYLLGANPVTVRTRLYYARRDFYRLLAEEPETGGEG